MKNEYYLKAADETKQQARDQHMGFYNTIEEAIEDVSRVEPDGTWYSVYDARTDKCVKRGKVRHITPPPRDNCQCEICLKWDEYHG